MNNCGDCTACCSVLEIKEISKPVNTMCGDCTGKGCGIYDNRPKTCQEFTCAYLNSDWSVDLRPDKSGVIIAPFRTEHTGQEYYAIRIKDEVNEGIMKKIQHIEDFNDISMIGRDGRPTKQ